MTIRVIAGSFKGRILSTIPGTHTRPTTDRAREAWASTITSLRAGGFVGARVLDAFAGSGALGIEALSRGAVSVLFVDNDSRAISVVRKNLSMLGVSNNSGIRALRADSLAPVAIKQLKASGPFDCVFLDPPYDYPKQRIGAFLHRLIAVGLLAEGCLVSYERRAARAGEQHGVGDATTVVKLSAALDNQITTAPAIAESDADASSPDPRASSPSAVWPGALKMVSCKQYGITAVEYHLFEPCAND